MTLIAAVMTAGLLGAVDGPNTFSSAKPVWPAGKDREMNLFVGFRAEVEPPQAAQVTLRLTASCLYRAWVNGQFAGHGPARGPHGWFRVDELDITPLLRPGPNVVAVEVAGYNVNSYYLIDQPSFLQAEVVAGSRVLASTGGEGVPFTAAVLPERVRKVARFSFQRPFTEVYRLKPGWDAWRSKPGAEWAGTAPALVEGGDPLPRRVPYSTFDRRPAVWQVAKGTLSPATPKEFWKDRSMVDTGPQLKGFPEADLEVNPSIDLQRTADSAPEKVDQAMAADTLLELPEHGWQVLDLGVNRTGFIGLEVTCRAPARLMVTFDEVLTNDNVDFKRLGCVNIVDLHLAPGTYHFESYEPYTARYLKLIAMNGASSVRGVYLREYVNPDVWRAHFAAADERLNRLFAAGRETFRQNATDIFMDCPSRERAGWLCDSFFTSRVAMDFSGRPVVEKNFLENFLLPSKFAFLPKGTLPMCYPADHYNSEFIPNWAMWFVVELEEYLARSGDAEMVKALEPRVIALLGFLKQYENSDGLLEKLPSWVFVEWSAANGFVQDVNYPSNMLYSGVLDAAGQMYGNSQWRERAEQVRQVIRKQSFDGEFFVDNALRKDGKLEVTRNRSETCQYYAFVFAAGTPEANADWFKRLCTEFGPQRKTTKAWPEIHPSNSFIGNMLRMEMLSQAGRSQQILNESIDYLLYMVDRTGTLWENVDAGASCNHGFASHIVHTLYRDILGAYRVDPVGRKVTLRFCPVDMPWCDGRIPLPDGSLELSWRKSAGGLEYRVSLPSGYQVTVENLTGGPLVRRP